MKLAGTWRQRRESPRGFDPQHSAREIGNLSYRDLERVFPIVNTPIKEAERHNI